ncbi:MAG: hypothetical protein OEY01_14435, partial [Desulfobulbaceae bacterium]|nr:hypothetical protein [Desulfobulbaceae bacterium]
FDDAAVEAAAWWEEQFTNCRRWPAPRPAKDPGEAWQNGVDIRAWIMAGLPVSLHREQTPAQEEKQIAVRAAQQAVVPTGEVAELLELLRASSGNITRSESGLNMSVNMDEDWRTANPKQAARLSELVFVAIEAGDYLSTLPDGIYSARNLVRG